MLRYRAFDRFFVFHFLPLDIPSFEYKALCVSSQLYAQCCLPDKGRTIRKVMGGGGEGDFKLAQFFFSPSACAGIFFAGKTLCTNFFFQTNIALFVSY